MDVRRNSRTIVRFTVRDRLSDTSSEDETRGHLRLSSTNTTKDLYKKSGARHMGLTGYLGTTLSQGGRKTH